jgi:demethylmenaquinone methyltransferase/2-methoxy-6-polyprenyl-1,4-benzoquinol methylase
MNENGYRPLQKMFMEVPARYDRMNRILTWRLDQRWRKLAARECTAEDPRKVLDLCTGTGDLAIHLARMMNGNTEIFGLDYSNPMLDIARRKALKKNIFSIQFIPGDAADMPFDDQSMDTIGIAFAFRNLTLRNRDRDMFLSEIYRVLKTGGKFVIVESSQPRYPFIRFLFHLYMRVVVSGLGSLLSKHRSAYKYLAFSAVHFYHPDELKKMLEEAGFRRIEYRPLLAGISGITVAIK